ncbi:hypothetical protein [Oceanobacillus locisalsi]|uniref:DUF4386 domain-containing protein n=1 Tax=Oceanobacillus locisalsi TaxID=546107 RepID=A0ABW3NKG3_9BACI
MYKLGGTLGVIYIFSIIIWIGIAVVYQGILYPMENQAADQTEWIHNALIYYSEHSWYFSIDHGSKAILFVFVAIFPVLLFTLFRKQEDENSSILNLIGMLFGVAYFIINAASLMMQAMIMSFVMNRYTTIGSDREFARQLFEWAVHGGGLSISLYIIANLSMVIWLSTHGYILYVYMQKKKFFYFSVMLSIFLFIGTLINFISMTIYHTNINLLNEVVSFLFIFWIAYVSYLFFKINNNSN